MWGIDLPVELEKDDQVGIRPKQVYHLVTHLNYDLLSPFNREIFWNDLDSAHEEVASILKRIGIWKFSGAPAITYHSRQATRWHTNLDIAMLRQKEPFIELTKRLANEGWFLFERKTHLGIIPHTTKIWPHTKIITLEYVHPLEELALASPNRNLVFVRRNESGILQYTNNARDRLNAYLHNEENGDLVCSEDGFRCPPQFFQTKEYSLRNGTTIPLISRNYLLKKKTELLENKGYKHNDPSKHHQDVFKLR